VTQDFSVLYSAVCVPWCLWWYFFCHRGTSSPQDL